MYLRSATAVKHALVQRLGFTTTAKLFALVLGIALSHTVHSESISAAEAAALYGAETTYSIYRKGKTIGKHSLMIKNTNGRINVSVDSKITIRILTIPVFKFRYLSDEAWESDQLLSVDSTTTTNKKIERATLNNNGNSSVLTNNNMGQNMPRILYATNHWHIGAVKQPQLFNTVKGTLANVMVQKIDNETLQIGDTSLSVTHYKYSGDIIVESWYDDNNRWVKLAFTGSDGSRITYVIDNP